MKMKFDFGKLTETVVRSLHQTGFALKKHSPEILVVSGVVGVITSTVLACQATTKVSAVLTAAAEELEKVDTVLADEHYASEYSKEDALKDKYVIYVQTAVSVFMLYAPSEGLGVLSVLSILASNNILRKRNMALAAAYTTIDKAFREYRSRVVDRFGRETDRELRYNIKKVLVDQTTVHEDGTVTTEKAEISVVDPNAVSDYAKFFDESSPNWEKNPELNLFFLRAEQKFANDLLVSRGHLFLNEVYDRLGIPRTKAGQVVGWMYDPNHPTGDNYVDFGIYDMDRPRVRNFVNGYERSILLDFNVDGAILDSNFSKI